MVQPQRVVYYGNMLNPEYLIRSLDDGTWLLVDCTDGDERTSSHTTWEELSEEVARRCLDAGAE